MKKVTQSTIAKMLGLSQISVSKALRGDTDISEKVRQEVSSLASELGYVANPFARTLAEGKSKIIGIFHANTRGKYFSVICECLDKEIRRHNYVPITVFPGSEEAGEDMAFQALLQYRVAGIIIRIRNATWEPRLLSLIRKNNIPTVLIGMTLIPNICSVYSDDYDGIRKAVRYLAERGHRNITLLSYLFDGLNPVAENKEKGFSDEVHQLGLPYHDSSIIRLPEDSDCRYVQKYMRENPETTAFICLSDERGLLVAKLLKEKGYKIPEKISIIGHGDDIECAELMLLPMTTIAHDAKNMGEKAVDLLMRQINGETIDESYKIENFILSRDSVKPVQGKGRNVK